jgi:hypothetical protein
VFRVLVAHGFRGLSEPIGGQGVNHKMSHSDGGQYGGIFPNIKSGGRSRAARTICVIRPRFAAHMKAALTDVVQHEMEIACPASPPISVICSPSAH